MTERRPIASRDTRWARSAAGFLVQRGVTPNAISIASMGMAALAGGAFWLSAEVAGGWRVAALLAAALFCQLRLICNLLDGMVAVEGGKAAPDGPFWNEAPDRVSDILILVGMGLGADAPALGFAAATFAVATAYVRELGRAIGLAPDFSGPMAKPQRMAGATICAVIAAFEPLWRGDNILVIGMFIIVLGAAFTALRRSMRIILALKAMSR